MIHKMYRDTVTRYSEYDTRSRYHIFGQLNIKPTLALVHSCVEPGFPVKRTHFNEHTLITLV